MPSIRHFTRHFALCLGLAVTGAGLVLTPSGAAVAADPPREIATAAFHAGLAATSKDIKMVHTHFHHVINCLVGPGGAGFDAREVNPCKDSGGGALVDVKDAAQQLALTAALDHARTGLMKEDVVAAQKMAAETEAMLKAIK